jgi:hypothetical protein
VKTSAICCSPGIWDLQNTSLHKLMEEVIFNIKVLRPGAHIFGTLAISTAPSLSLNILHLMIGVSTLSITPRVAASWANESNGITSLAEVDNAINSASVVESAISVCNLDPHNNGHLAYAITYPVQDLAVAGSSMEDSCFQSPACDAST